MIIKITTPDVQKIISASIQNGNNEPIEISYTEDESLVVAQQLMILSHAVEADYILNHPEAI